MPQRKNISRRQFLRQSAAASAAGAAFVAAPHVALGGVPSANERIRIGFIGSGHRARLLMKQTPKEGEIVAICDVDLSRCARARDEFKRTWDTYQDYRRLLERKDIDAVIVPTTDHGRVLPCVHACQAGKDIYAEKPLTLTISEGRVLVRAVRKYGRVFQTGTQQRSMEMNRFACDFVRSGGLGKLKEVKGHKYTSPRTCPNLPGQPTPRQLDWDLWCAQTELKPYNERLQKGWMGCRDYSGGDMTNWGAHGVDQVQWALDADATGPVEMWTEAPGPNAPVTFRYADGLLYKLELEKGPKGGAVFIGEKGQIEIDRNRFRATPEDLVREPPAKQFAEMWEGPGWQAKYHIGDWLECIRTRELPVADVEIGHRSVSVCHLANITRELGRRLRWNPDSERFVDDAEADALISRPVRAGYELPLV